MSDPAITGSISAQSHVTSTNWDTCLYSLVIRDIIPLKGRAYEQPIQRS
jgi:hypothetical protein